MGTVKKNSKIEKIDMNFYINKKTGSVQIFPRVSLAKLYFKSHGSGKVGTLWAKHHKSFVDFINYKSNTNILEIGGGHNSISLSNKRKKNVKVISFDPNRDKAYNNESVINDFFSEASLKKYNLENKFDLAVHSHLFEHIYNPDEFLLSIHKSLKKDGLHIFTVPNMDRMIKENIASTMNFEHPFFLNEKTIKILLGKIGFKILKKYYYGKYHSIFFKTIKIEKKNKNISKNIIKSDFSKNLRIFRDLSNNWKKDVNKINKTILMKKNIFLFGAHIFSQILIMNGLNIQNIVGILDNDDDKQGEYLYGTNLKVFDPKILQKYINPIIILRTGAYNKEIKKQINFINNSTVFI